MFTLKNCGSAGAKMDEPTTLTSLMWAQQTELMEARIEHALKTYRVPEKEWPLYTWVAQYVYMDGLRDGMSLMKAIENVVTKQGE